LPFLKIFQDEAKTSFKAVASVHLDGRVGGKIFQNDAAGKHSQRHGKSICTINRNQTTVDLQQTLQQTFHQHVLKKLRLLLT